MFGALDISYKSEALMLDRALMQMLLEAALSNPEAGVMSLPLMTEEAVESMRRATNPHPPKGNPAAICLHQLFEAAAKSHPGAACIRADSGTLTYAEVLHCGTLP